MTAWFNTAGSWYNTLFRIAMITENTILPFICSILERDTDRTVHDFLKYDFNKNSRAKVILIRFNKDTIGITVTMHYDLF